MTLQDGIERRVLQGAAYDMNAVHNKDYILGIFFE